MLSKSKRRELQKDEFKTSRTEEKYFSVKEFTGGYAVIRFAGVDEIFHFGSETMRIDNGTVIEESDRLVLFRLASTLCSAARAGYAENGSIEHTEYALFGELPITEKRTKNRQRKARPLPGSSSKRTAFMLNKARETQLYQYFTEESKSEQRFHIVLTRSDLVSLRFKNTTHDYIYNHGVAEHVDTQVWLSRKDFAFGCVFAEQLMNARDKGNRLPKKHEPRKKTEHQLTLPI